MTRIRQENRSDAPASLNLLAAAGRGNDAARAFYRRHGYGERVGVELLDKMLTGSR